MIFGELYRNADDWEIRATGRALLGGLSPGATRFSAGDPYRANKCWGGEARRGRGRVLRSGDRRRAPGSTRQSNDRGAHLHSRDLTRLEEPMSQRAPEGSGTGTNSRIVGLLALAPWILLLVIIVCATLVAIFAPAQFHDFLELTRVVRSGPSTTST
jgi:hypothetical protein